MKHSSPHFPLRRDHAAGGALVALGLGAAALSLDLPFGSLASPGAGMLPIIAITLIVLFGVAIAARGAASPPLASVDWSDLPHAARVSALAAAAVAAYTVLGFLVTVPLLLFGLTFVVERRRPLAAAAFSAGVALLLYFSFGALLKTPLPRGLLGF